MELGSSANCFAITLPLNFFRAATVLPLTSLTNGFRSRVEIGSRPVQVVINDIVCARDRFGPVRFGNYGGCGVHRRQRSSFDSRHIDGPVPLSLSDAVSEKIETEVKRTRTLVLNKQAAPGSSPFKERHARQRLERIDGHRVGGTSEKAAARVAAVQIDRST